ISVLAGRTPDIVRGISSGFVEIPLGGQYTSGVLSSAGIDGGNGGWPIFFGADPLAGQTLRAAFDEDQVLDDERNHTTEEVDFILVQ
ncbi:MAG: hypothetical protein AAF265_14355, partial [Pseudomonadota bacterium]